MLRLPILMLVMVMSLLFGACANEFEKVRTSNDPKLILKKANEYFEKEEWLNAQALYEIAIQSYRGKIEAENIFYNLARTFYKNGEYITASQYFTNFSTTFGNSPKKEEAEYMAAYSNFKLSPNYKLDQTYSIKSIQMLEDFINKYPSSSRIAECNKLIDGMRAKLEKKAHYQGILYYNVKEYQSAVKAFEVMLKEYPGSSYDSEAKYLLIKASYELADKSIEDKKVERFTETIGYCTKYMDKVKDKKYSKEIKDIYQSALKKINT